MVCVPEKRTLAVTDRYALSLVLDLILLPGLHGYGRRGLSDAHRELVLRAVAVTVRRKRRGEKPDIFSSTSQRSLLDWIDQSLPCARLRDFFFNMVLVDVANSFMLEFCSNVSF